MEVPAPLISIIVPVYNVEKYLKDCLSSVQEQTLRDFECLCVDSGSDDSSVSILKEFAAKDPRFRVFSDEKMKSVGQARNKGIREAKGRYIFFLDSDDFMASQTLEILMTFLETHNADIVCCSFQKVPENAAFQKQNVIDLENFKYRLTSIPLKDFMEKTLPIESMVWNKLYRAPLVKSVNFMEGLRRGEDEAFTLEILNKTRRLMVLPLPFISYRIRPSSLSKEAISAQYLEDYALVLPYLYKLLTEGKDERDHRQIRAFFAKKIYKRYITHVLDKTKKGEREILKKLSREKLRQLRDENILQIKDLPFFKRLRLYFFLRKKTV